MASYGYTDLTLADAVARQGETIVNRKVVAAGKQKRNVPRFVAAGKAMRAMPRKLDASIVLKGRNESDADFKARFYAAISLFGVEQIMVWHGDGAPSMLHAAIQNPMRSSKTHWVIHTLIDMGADVHVRGEEWFSGLRLNPLELCAYRLGNALKGPGLISQAAEGREGVGVMEERISGYCDLIDHLKAAGAALKTGGHMSAYDCVFAGLRHDVGDVTNSRRGVQFVLAIMGNERFRRTFNLQDLSGYSAVDARAAVVEEYQVESAVAASKKRCGDYGEVVSVLDSALETESESESDSEDKN